MTPADMYRDTKANLERRYSNPHAKRRGTIASALVLVAIVALLECVFYVLYSMSSSTVLIARSPHPRAARPSHRRR